MQDRTDAGQSRYRTKPMQDRSDSRQVRYKTGQMQDRLATGQGRCRTDQIQNRPYAKQDGCRTGWRQDMTIAGQGGCWKKEEDKEQDGCMAGRMLDRTDRTGQRHDRCRCKTGRMQYRSVAGVDVCRTGWMQERTDSVQGRYRKSQMPNGIHITGIYRCRTGKIQNIFLAKRS